MTLYSRPQLGVLLLVVAVAGLGLGVGHWRRANPDLAARIERFDQPPEAGAGRPPTASTGLDALVPLDVNRASAQELVQLPGVGPALADRIVTARELGGPFASVDDLRRVRGLGASKIDRFRSLVTVGPPRMTQSP